MLWGSNRSRDVGEPEKNRGGTRDVALQDLWCVTLWCVCCNYRENIAAPKNFSAPKSSSKSKAAGINEIASPVEVRENVMAVATRKNNTAGTPASSPPLAPSIPAIKRRTTPIRVSGMTKIVLTKRSLVEELSHGRAGRPDTGSGVGFLEC